MFWSLGRWSVSSKKALSACALLGVVKCAVGVRIQLALFYPQDYGFDGGAVRAVERNVSALQRSTQQRSCRVLSGGC